MLDEEPIVPAEIEPIQRVLKPAKRIIENTEKDPYKSSSVHYSDRVIPQKRRLVRKVTTVSLPLRPPPLISSTTPKKQSKGQFVVNAECQHEHDQARRPISNPKPLRSLNQEDLRLQKALHKQRFKDGYQVPVKPLSAPSPTDDIQREVREKFYDREKVHAYMVEKKMREKERERQRRLEKQRLVELRKAIRKQSSLWKRVDGVVPRVRKVKRDLVENDENVHVNQVSLENWNDHAPTPPPPLQPPQNHLKMEGVKHNDYPTTNNINMGRQFTTHPQPPPFSTHPISSQKVPPIIQPPVPNSHSYDARIVSLLTMTHSLQTRIESLLNAPTPTSSTPSSDFSDSFSEKVNLLVEGTHKIMNDAISTRARYPDDDKYKTGLENEQEQENVKLERKVESGSTKMTHLHIQTQHDKFPTMSNDRVNVLKSPSDVGDYERWVNSVAPEPDYDVLEEVVISPTKLLPDPNELGGLVSPTDEKNSETEVIRYDSIKEKRNSQEKDDQTTGNQKNVVPSVTIDIDVSENENPSDPIVIVTEPQSNHDNETRTNAQDFKGETDQEGPKSPDVYEMANRIEAFLETMVVDQPDLTPLTPVTPLPFLHDGHIERTRTNDHEYVGEENNDIEYVITEQPAKKKEKVLVVLPKVDGDEYTFANVFDRKLKKLSSALVPGTKEEEIIISLKPHHIETPEETIEVIRAPKIEDMKQKETIEEPIAVDTYSESFEEPSESVSNIESLHENNGPKSDPVTHRSPSSTVDSSTDTTTESIHHPPRSLLPQPPTLSNLPQEQNERYSPRSLSKMFSANLQMLEALDASHVQVTELERVRQLESMHHQLSEDLESIRGLKSRTDTKKKPEGVQKQGDEGEYEDDFESLQPTESEDVHSTSISNVEEDIDLDSVPDSISSVAEDSNILSHPYPPRSHDFNVTNGEELGGTEPGSDDVSVDDLKFAKVSLHHIKKIIASERSKMKARDILLTLKEKTLEECTRAEVKWIRHQRRKNAGMSAKEIKKAHNVERAIMMRFAAEKAEIERLRKENEEMSKQRQKKILEAQVRAAYDQKRTKLGQGRNKNYSRNEDGVDEMEEEIERLTSHASSIAESIHDSATSIPESIPSDEQVYSEDFETPDESGSFLSSIDDNELRALAEKLKTLKQDIDRTHLKSQLDQIERTKSLAREIIHRRNKKLKWKNRLKEEIDELNAVLDEAIEKEIEECDKRLQPCELSSTSVYDEEEGSETSVLDDVPSEIVSGENDDSIPEMLENGDEEAEVIVSEHETHQRTEFDDSESKEDISSAETLEPSENDSIGVAARTMIEKIKSIQAQVEETKHDIRDLESRKKEQRQDLGKKLENKQTMLLRELEVLNKQKDELSHQKAIDSSPVEEHVELQSTVEKPIVAEPVETIQHEPSYDEDFEDLTLTDAVSVHDSHDPSVVDQLLSDARLESAYKEERGAVDTHQRQTESESIVLKQPKSAAVESMLHQVAESLAAMVPAQTSNDGKVVENRGEEKSWPKNVSCTGSDIATIGDMILDEILTSVVEEANKETRRKVDVKVIVDELIAGKLAAGETGLAMMRQPVDDYIPGLRDKQEPVRGRYRLVMDALNEALYAATHLRKGLVAPSLESIKHQVVVWSQYYDCNRENLDNLLIEETALDEYVWTRTASSNSNEALVDFLTARIFDDMLTDATFSANR